MKRTNSSHAASLAEHSQALRISAYVCIVLLAFLMFVQAAHVHPAGSNPDQCPICIAMHSAAPVRSHAAVLTSTWHSELVIQYRARTLATELHCKLYNRPPPSLV